MRCNLVYRIAQAVGSSVIFCQAGGKELGSGLLPGQGSDDVRVRVR